MIIVDNEGDFSFFNNIKDAEISMEAVDVEDGRYRVFDRTTREAILQCSKTEDKKNRIFIFGSGVKYVKIIGFSEISSDEAQALHHRLKQFLEYVANKHGWDENEFSNYSFADLISTVEKNKLVQ
jgi:hypothetical protein